MTLTAQKIWQLPLLLLALWLGGCAMQYDPDEFLRPQYPEGDLNLVLNIHTGDRTLKATRAETQYDNNDGVDFEPTTIDRELINTLRIIIVKDNPEGNDTIVHNEYLDLRTAPTDYVNGLKYSVFYDTQYNVYLIGNEEGLPIASLPQGQSSWKTYLDSYAKYQNYSGKTPLEDITISATSAGAPIIPAGNTNPVPMTEIFPVKTITKQEAEAQDKPDSEGVIQNETFFLTRAASKFSFYFFRGAEFTDASQETRTIDKIKITGLGKSEYLFPNSTVYLPAKNEERETTNRRDIKEFKLPSDSYQTEAFEFNMATPLRVADLPVKTSGFNSNYPLAGLTEAQIAACQFIPEMYFPESKGKDYNGTDTRGQEYTFECSIAYDGGDFLEPVKLPNLPHALPRNTHVVVIVTIHDRYMTVDVIPFTAVVLKPDFGLEREQFTGYVVGGKDADGNQYWYDANYYEPVDANDPPTKYYLGPKDKEGELVTINDKRYMLVYADYDEPVWNADWSAIDHYVKHPGYERTANTLHHFFEVFTETDADGKEVATKQPVKHMNNVDAICGYQPLGDSKYINDNKQRVFVINDGIFPFPGAFNEWRIEDYGPGVWNAAPGYYPIQWIDILGNKNPVPEPPTYPIEPTEPLSPKATDFGINVESNPWEGTEEQWAAYNKAIANYNLEHSIWEADMQKWNAEVENWRPLDEKWKTDFTTIRETKLGEWVNYLKD